MVLLAAMGSCSRGVGKDKHIVMVCRDQDADGFIITAFLTVMPLWRKATRTTRRHSGL